MIILLIADLCLFYVLIPTKWAKCTGVCLGLLFFFFYKSTAEDWKANGRSYPNLGIVYLLELAVYSCHLHAPLGTAALNSTSGLSVP